MKPAIEITEISKRFRLGGQPSGYRTLRESLMNGLDRAWLAGNAAVLCITTGMVVRLARSRNVQ